MNKSFAAKKLWAPGDDWIRQSHMYRFMEFVDKPYEKYSYSDLHRWSVEESDDFWKMLLEFSEIIFDGDHDPVVVPETMPEAKFFPNLRLNFTENLLRFNDDLPAIVSVTESRETQKFSYRELRQEVARIAAWLRDIGIEPCDRIAGYIPNSSEAVIAMLAATSLGAVWTSCSPDFGVQGVLDRFGQTKPRVLFAANGYRYNGKLFYCLEKIQEISGAIPEIEKVVLIPFVPDCPSTIKGQPGQVFAWGQLGVSETVELTFDSYSFNHPLYIMYSSGTTGMPKCIVHGAGGTLLQHAKELLLHTNLKRESKILYFTTCGWMMWNWLVSSLFTGCTVVLFDGSPAYPDLDILWALLEKEEITHFGTSPKFLETCRGKVFPGKKFNLSKLEVMLSTGAPLLPEDFDWVYSEVKSDLQLSSISGGTDIISCFMLGNPILPVYRGELQSFGLGMDVASFNENYEAVFGDKGELVCKKPFASMPIGFWDDLSGEKYRNAYFDKVDNIWFHGDYISITGTQGSAGGVVVFGRSDTTLNPGGVRIGTAEVYRLVEQLAEVEDSIVIGQPWKGDVRIVLFVKLTPGVEWSDDLKEKIKKTIRINATPRHTPSRVIPVEKIPYTISGKKVEMAVLKVVQGRTPKNKSALVDASALECYRGITELTVD